MLVVNCATGKTLGPVLGGYDMVAYQTSLSAGDLGVMGSEKFSFDLLATDDSNTTEKMEPTNYTFYFSSAENLSLFRDDPWKYAPQFGGF